ncbi:hypothetical protein AX769_05655 [Frondihabitans sp. PAMC 28766]|nr:hypothetical protein AX769_05655 [Frondihabitans sp. PAMC 28766]
MPGRTYGSLVFAVSNRDEPLPWRGITVLTRALILDLLYPQAFEVEIVAGSEQVAFQVSGTPIQVQERLKEIADVVSDLSQTTVDAFAKTKERVSRSSSIGPTLEPGVLSVRYGLADIGLEDIASRALEAMTLETVTTWAAEWFVAENADVTMSKPLPASFDVNLPGRHSAVTRGSFAVSALDRPTLTSVGYDSLVLSLVMPSATADVVYLPVLHELYDSTVMRHGFAENVSAARPMRVDASQSHLKFRFHKVDRAKSVERIVTALRKIARAGVAAESLSLAVERLRTRYEEPASVDVRLGRQSGAALRGITDAGLAEELQTVLQLSSNDVASAVENALPTLLVSVDSQRPDIVQTLARKNRLELDLNHRDLVRSTTGTTPARLNDVMTFTTDSIAGEGETVALSSEGLFFTSARGNTKIDFADIRLIGDDRPWSVVLIDQGGRTETLSQENWDIDFLDALIDAAPRDRIEVW